jgi:hypothetical protein
MKLKKSLYVAIPILIVLLLMLLLLWNFFGGSSKTSTKNHTIGGDYEYSISEEEIPNMSTKELAQNILKYPDLMEYAIYDSYETAAKKFMKSCPGFEELYSRKDVREVLLSMYEESMPLSDNDEIVEKCKTIEATDYDSPILQEVYYRLTETANLEFLIGSDKLFNGEYSKSEAATLKKLVAQKNEIREESIFYSGPSFMYESLMADEQDK